MYGPGGVYENWKVWNSASNGSLLRDWTANIVTGIQGAAPIDGEDATRNPWRVVNANPDEIVIMLGTNDARLIGGGYTYASVAALLAGMTADLKTLCDFFLDRCKKARIELQIPPLLTYISSGMTAFTNYTNSTDAYDRNKAIRDAYYTMANYSSRITVSDTHRAFFGIGVPEASLRWDSLAASVDPRANIGTTIIKVDELHLTPFGQVRRWQIAQNRRVPGLADNTKYNIPSVVTNYTALLDTRAYIKGVGAGYIDFYSNTIMRAYGTRSAFADTSMLYRETAESLWLSGFQAKLYQILQSQIINVIDSVGTVYQLTPTSMTHTVVDTYSDYFRVSFAGGATPSLLAGPADLYVNSPDRLARTMQRTVGMVLHLDGKDATPAGRAVIPLTPTGLANQGLPALSASTIQVNRDLAPDAATFDVYFENVWDGSFDSTNATYDKVTPGIKMGTINIASGWKTNSTWTASADGTALAGLCPPHGYPAVSLYVVKMTGSIGAWANVTLLCRAGY